MSSDARRLTPRFSFRTNYISNEQRQTDSYQLLNFVDVKENRHHGLISGTAPSRWNGVDI